MTLPVVVPVRPGLRIFGRDPIVWLATIQSVLAIVVNLPVSPLSGAQAAWFITALSAVFMAAEAWSVRPWTPAMLTGAVRTTISAVVLFGLPITDELAGTIVAGVTTVFALIVMHGVTPSAFPDPTFRPAAVAVSPGRHAPTE